MLMEAEEVDSRVASHVTKRKEHENEKEVREKDSNMLIKEEEVNKIELVLPNSNIRRSVSCKTAYTSFTPTQLTERNSSSRPSTASLAVHSELLPDGYTIHDCWGLLVSEHASYKCTFSQSSLTIGRGLECDVVVNDPRVSNHHFTITLEREVVMENQRLPAKKLETAVQKQKNVKRTLEKDIVYCKSVIRADKNKNFLPATAHLGCSSFVEQSNNANSIKEKNKVKQQLYEEEKEQLQLEEEENTEERVHLLHKIVMRVLLEDHSTNGTYVNDLRIGRGRRCELKNGDDIAIVLLPEKRSRRSDDSLIDIKLSNDNDKDEERLGEHKNDRICSNERTNLNVYSNAISHKCQNKPQSNHGNAHENAKNWNKSNECEPQVHIADSKESRVRWIPDISDERTYLERFCFHLYPKENAIEVKSNQSLASVNVDSSTVNSANSGNVSTENTTSPICVDSEGNATKTSKKLIIPSNNNKSNSSISNINDSNKILLDKVITGEVSNRPYMTPSHPLSAPSAVRVIRSDNDLIQNPQNQQQQQQQQQQKERKRGQNWFNDVRDNFIAPQRASSRWRDASPAVLSSSSLVASTLGRLTPLLTPANDQSNLANNVVNYSIMPRRPLQWGPCIGSGASGKVHLGIDVTSSKLVAIKVLKGTRLSSKSQERNSIGSLRTNSSNSYSESNDNYKITSNSNSSSSNNGSAGGNSAANGSERNEQVRKRVKTDESNNFSENHEVTAIDEEQQESSHKNEINEGNRNWNSIINNSRSRSGSKCSSSTSTSATSSILSISDISVTNTHDSDDETDNNNNINNNDDEEEEAKLIYENKAKIIRANSSERNINTTECKNSKQMEKDDYSCKRPDWRVHGLNDSCDLEGHTDITNVLTPAHVRELWMLTRLQNHRMVRCLGFQYEEEKGLCIMMEYVAGGTLQSLIKSFGIFEENVIRMYTLQILEGLEYLEQNEVVHGDLKSSNVLVSERGNVKLTDFGTSHILRDVNMQSKRTESHTSTNNDNHQEIDNLSVSIERSSSKGSSNGNNSDSISNRKNHNCQWKHVLCNGDVLCGTPLYMSPELIRTQISTHASDVWALGCVVFEMATGGILPWREVHHLGAHSIIYHIGSHVDSGPSLTDLYLTRASHSEATHHEMWSSTRNKREETAPRQGPGTAASEEREEEQQEEEQEESEEKYKYMPNPKFKREQEEEEEEEWRNVEQNHYVQEQRELYKKQLSQSKLREMKIMHEKMLKVWNKEMYIHSEELTPSITLIDFIQCMLTIDCNTRPKASELLHHPFILGENTTEALLRWHEYCAMRRTQETHKKNDDSNIVMESNVEELQRVTDIVESNENNTTTNNKNIVECNDKALRISGDNNGINNNSCQRTLVNNFSATEIQEKIERLINSELHNDIITSQSHDECPKDSTSNEKCNSANAINHNYEQNEVNELDDNHKEHMNFEEDNNNVMTQSQKSQSLITAPALALTRTNLQWYDDKCKNTCSKAMASSSPSLTSAAQSSPCICCKMEYNDSNAQNVYCSYLHANSQENYRNCNKCDCINENRKFKHETLLSDTNKELQSSSHLRSSITPLSLAPSTNYDNESDKCQSDILVKTSYNNNTNKTNLVENNTENVNESKAINLQSFGRLYTNCASNNRPVYTEEWPSVTVNRPFHSTLRSHQQYLRRHEQERHWMEMSNHYINNTNTNKNNNKLNWHEYHSCKLKFYKGQEHYNEQYVHYQNYHHRSPFATCDETNMQKLEGNTVTISINNSSYNDRNNNSYNNTNKRFKNNSLFYNAAATNSSTTTVNTTINCKNMNTSPFNFVNVDDSDSHQQKVTSSNSHFDAMTQNEIIGYNQNRNMNKNIEQKNKMIDHENSDKLLLSSANVLQASSDPKSEQRTSPFTNKGTIATTSDGTEKFLFTHEPPSYSTRDKPFCKPTSQSLGWQHEHFLSCGNNNSNNRKKCKMKNANNQLHRTYSGDCTEKNGKPFICKDKVVSNNTRKWSNKELCTMSSITDSSYQATPATTSNSNSYNTIAVNQQRNVVIENKSRSNVIDYKSTKYHKNNSKYHNKYISARKNVSNQTRHMNSTVVKRERQQRQYKVTKKSGLTTEFADLFSSSEVFASSDKKRKDATNKRKYNKSEANTDNKTTIATTEVTPLDIYEEYNLESCDRFDAETCTSRGDNNNNNVQEQVSKNTKLHDNPDSQDDE